MSAPVVLTLDEVLALHADQIERYGGSPVAAGQADKAEVAVFLKAHLQSA